MSTPEPLVTGTDFVTVSATDIDRATEFYGTTLGLPLTARYGEMPGVEFETGNLTIAVLKSDAFGIEARTNNHPIALNVADVEAARTELESRGVKFLAETIDSGVCHMAPFEDSEGNTLMLHHRYAPRTPLA
jgi:predicted enzyme related to lactoylglutathione lyase